ncbi:MAG: RsmB/NOP family class I SAM-dependent RNA methyltransferase [Chakrabartia sp.]
MTPAARVQTAIEILDTILAAARDNGPAADAVIAQAFRDRRYAGSKDKKAIREMIYRAIRSYGAPPSSGRAALLGLREDDLQAQFGSGGYGPAAILADEPCATPSVIAPWMAEALLPFIDADEQAALLARAPLDVRANRLKTSRDDLMAELGGEPIAGLPDGLRLAEGADLLTSAAYLQGRVEVQDAGSQMISLICGAQPGMTVVDLCAGAGGKTLALASDMAGAGRLIACDTDRARLSRLPGRAERAGARVDIRLLNPQREAEALADLDGQADLVLVDAPCSGSGTWRRNPELRWRLTPARLGRVCGLQAHVLDVAAPLVRPGGVLVYAVCSLFSQEGEAQIAAFLGRHSGWEVDLPDLGLGRRTASGYAFTPFHDGTDGFFVARLRRSC